MKFASIDPTLTSTVETKRMIIIQLWKYEEVSIIVLIQNDILLFTLRLRITSRHKVWYTTIDRLLKKNDQFNFQIKLLYKCDVIASYFFIHNMRFSYVKSTTWVLTVIMNVENNKLNGLTFFEDCR